MATGYSEYGAQIGIMQGFGGMEKMIISGKILCHGPRESLYPWAKPKRLDRDPAMNISSEMNFEDMLRVRLEVLRREHRDLDEAIAALESAGRPDQLTLRRLKKQKLALKDQIVKFEDQLIPDIIA